jgi:cyclase
MDTDGMKSGFDIELTKLVKERVGVSVIASGGAGTMEHIYDAFEKANADAALAASIFHFREIEIAALKSYLHDRGVKVRV